MDINWNKEINDLHFDIVSIYCLIVSLTFIPTLSLCPLFFWLLFHVIIVANFFFLCLVCSYLILGTILVRNWITTESNCMYWEKECNWVRGNRKLQNKHVICTYSSGFSSNCCFQITFYVVIDMNIATIVRKSDSLIFSRVRVGERMALEVL